MEGTAPGIRRLCLAFGIEPAEGQAFDLGQSEQRTIAALVSVCASMGLDRMLLNASEPGKEQVALLPVGIDEPRVVSSLIDGLARAIAELNAACPAAALRLRLAFHEGVTVLAGDSFSGTPVDRVRELAADAHLRAALATDPRAGLAVLLSDPVFEGIDQCEDLVLPRSQFRRVDLGASGADRRAWIYAPQPASAGSRSITGGEPRRHCSDSLACSPAVPPSSSLALKPGPWRWSRPDSYSFSSP